MKVSVYIATSLDGFIAREDGSLDWLPGSDGQVDPELGDEDFGYKAFFDSVDTLVMGRNTYEMVQAFGQWPYADKHVIVLSSSLTTLDKTLPNSVELRNCSASELHAELAGSNAQHVYVDGGRTIQGFLAAGLIDQITITRIPVLIGSGIPLFAAVAADIHLQHLETLAFANGFVQSCYRLRH